ncbi:MAG: methyltransferase domain-containing protein [Cytophagales bacterium]
MEINENQTEACCVVTCDLDLGQNYWDNHYQAEKIGWDLGEVSPPLKAYIDQLENKHARVLIPGCGNTYEAEYLLEKGFTNVTVIDIAPTLVENLRQKFAGNPNISIVLGDFFAHEGEYDLVLEQTFFCAISPTLRQNYADKMRDLLASGGKLAGVMFDKEFEFQGPPFGGCKCKYMGYFEPYFDIKIAEKCYNSAAKRKDEELFVCFVKK